MQRGLQSVNTNRGGSGTLPESSQKPTASARAPVRFDVAVLVRPLASATVSTTVQLRA